MKQSQIQTEWTAIRAGTDNVKIIIENRDFHVRHPSHEAYLYRYKRQI